MNSDEFAFFNLQLAAMLKSGVALEGALRQLCATMKSGALRRELEQLETELARGTPLPQALAARQLPELYVQLLTIGTRSNDLPGVLTLAADHYARTHSVWTRLKGLLVYPLIVLIASLALSIALAFIYTTVVEAIAIENIFPGQRSPVSQVALWFTPVMLAMVVAGVLLVLVVPAWRDALRGRLPGFKEARLAQLASSLSLLLQRGGVLPDALSLLAKLERGSAAGVELSRWHTRLSKGLARVTEFAAEGRFFPPLFLWLVAGAGADLAAGFRRAAEIYHARAVARVEMMLYAFLPVSVIVLGVMLLSQAAPVLRMFQVFNSTLEPDQW